MATLPAPLLGMSATVLIVLFYFYTGLRVAAMRGKHGIIAPACSGHPEFDRAYRVQMNTLEQMAVALPLLWVATIYPVFSPWIAPAAALLWIVGRILYMRGYMIEPAKRELGMTIGGIASLVLLIMALTGLAFAWHGVAARF